MIDEDAIREAELRRCALINALDLTTLATLLADDYAHVHANGAVTDRTETLGRIAAQPRQVERGELCVRAWGDTAILIGEQHSRMTPTDAPSRVMRGAVTQVLRRERRNWLFVSFQMTTLQGLTHFKPSHDRKGERMTRHSLITYQASGGPQAGIVVDDGLVAG